MADETTTTDTTTSTETETATTEVAAETSTDTSTDTSTETTQETNADEGTFLANAGKEKPESKEGDDSEGADDADKGEAEGDEPGDGAPEAYEIALKDEEGNDIALDQDMLGKATDMFREMNLTNEQANQLVPLGQEMLTKGMQAMAEQSANDHSQMKKAWFEELEADEELGGSKLGETEHLAAKGLDALGFTEGHPFREMLDVSGLGNHRDMALVFSTLGKVAGEGTLFAQSESASETKEVGWADRYKD